MAFTKFTTSESIEVPDPDKQAAANQRLAKTGSTSAAQLSEEERLKLQAELADTEGDDQGA